MHRRLLLAAAISACCVRPGLAETRQVHSPGDGYLNLRSGPGVNFAVLREMPHGSVADILEWSGTWVRVRHESGAVGWASAKYLKGMAPSNILYVADPKDGWLNLRTGPGTSFGIVTRMDNGTWVEVLERAGDWVRVQHQYGATGWTYRPYLSR